jgi:hypothetical protein
MIRGLPADIRELLARGAGYWSSEGPGHLDEDLARLMQLHEVGSASRHLADVSRRLTADEAVSVLDLTRALWLAEIGLISVVVGPSDWDNVYSPTADLDTFMNGEIALLRRAQDELADIGVPASGTDPFGKQHRSLRSLTSRLVNPPAAHGSSENCRTRRFPSRGPRRT